MTLKRRVIETILSLVLVIGAPLAVWYVMASDIPLWVNILFVIGSIVGFYFFGVKGLLAAHRCQNCGRFFTSENIGYKYMNDDPDWNRSHKLVEGLLYSKLEHYKCRRCGYEWTIKTQSDNLFR